MSESTSNSTSRPDLPNGMLALLFTDIEGSTLLLQALGERYPAQLEAHRRILRAAFAAHGGVEVDSQGDSFFAVFRSVKGAINAVVQAQRGLNAFPWPENFPLRVRMGLHCGEPMPTREGYVGVDLHRGARLMSAGHGGQILLSGAAAPLAGDLPANCELRDRGEHRLKDLAAPEAIFELCIEDLPSEFLPLRTLDGRLHNLPAHLPPILGRESEIETLRARLEAGTRLTTLLGPGGTGKTRLSLEIAAATLAMWEDGTYFVPLAPHSASTPGASEAAIASALARELGLRDDGSQAVQERLLAHLQTRQMLLVLDNFEHLTLGAGVVARWLGSCPRLQILATSRVPLRLGGEQEVPIAPLSLPQRGTSPDAATLSQYASVALFIARARAVKPDFAVNEANAPAIAEICVRLDGLPLAIELAAARIKLLPPATMMARLERSLSFLVGGPRDAAARQQTLRAAIAWSYDLLGDDEKRLFRRLGVFRGGFGFEGAERVCGESESDAGAPLDVFEGISALIDQSLLVIGDEVDGQARFGMLETIREFALDELDLAGEGEILRERHAEWCWEETTARDAQMSVDLPRALLLFEAGADNWRAAWGWAITSQPDFALQLASGATLLWNRIGATTEQYERLQTSLRAAPAAEAKNRCRALHFLAQFERNRLNWARHEAWLQQLETGARETDLTGFQAIARDHRRWEEVRLGRLESALELGAQVIQLRRLDLGQVQSETRDAGEVKSCEIELSDALILQAEVLAMLGRFDEAWDVMDKSLAQKRAIGDELSLTFGLYKQAQLLAGTGRIAQARPVYEEIVARTENSGDRSVVLAWYCHEAALMALHEGDSQRARELLRASYERWQENAPGAGFLPTLHALSWLHGLESDWRAVARALGASQALRGAPFPKDFRAVLETQENDARDALGESDFEAERAAGAQIGAQQIVEAAFNSE